MTSGRPSLGAVFTFYAYKGGTGRSMALANTACLLGQRTSASSERTLAIDWDLEAPGLHRFFPRAQERAAFDSTPGLLDYFSDLEKLFIDEPGAYQRLESPSSGEMLNNLLSLESYVISDIATGLDIMKAGRFDAGYSRRVSGFDWATFHTKFPLAVTAFRLNVAAQYRYSLIDSRTGLNDVSGICAAILPEKLIIVFTPNDQSLLGGLEVIGRAIQYRRGSDDFRPLAIYPLPSRIELGEKTLRERWRTKYQNGFESSFKELFDLSECDLTGYFNDVQIPHVSYYSYGETIAVLHERSEALSLGRAYEVFVSRLLGTNTAWEAPSKPEDQLTEQHAKQSPKKVYDVFVSYRIEDVELASQLGHRLQRYGMRPYVPAWEVLPGQDVLEGLENTLANSTAAIVLVGEDGAGPWDDVEVKWLLEQRSQDRSARVIPVLLPNAGQEIRLPDFLRRRNFVDFRSGIDDDASFLRLIAGIKGEPVNSRVTITFARLEQMFIADDKHRYQVVLAVDLDGRSTSGRVDVTVPLPLDTGLVAPQIAQTSLTVLANVDQAQLNEEISNYVRDAIRSAGTSIPRVIQLSRKRVLVGRRLNQN
jgi:hypothetical protein